MQNKLDMNKIIKSLCPNGQGVRGLSTLSLMQLAAIGREASEEMSHRLAGEPLHFTWNIGRATRCDTACNFILQRDEVYKLQSGMLYGHTCNASRRFWMTRTSDGAVFHAEFDEPSVNFVSELIDWLGFPDEETVPGEEYTLVQKIPTEAREDALDRDAIIREYAKLCFPTPAGRRMPLKRMEVKE